MPLSLLTGRLVCEDAFKYSLPLNLFLYPPRNGFFMFDFSISTMTSLYWLFSRLMCTVMTSGELYFSLGSYDFNGWLVGSAEAIFSCMMPFGSTPKSLSFRESSLSTVSAEILLEVNVNLT